MTAVLSVIRIEAEKYTYRSRGIFNPFRSGGHGHEAQQGCKSMILILSLPPPSVGPNVRFPPQFCADFSRFLQAHSGCIYLHVPCFFSPQKTMQSRGRKYCKLPWPPTLTFRASPKPFSGKEHSHTDTRLTVLSRSQCGLINLTKSHHISRFSVLENVN